MSVASLTKASVKSADECRLQTNFSSTERTLPKISASKRVPRQRSVRHVDFLPSRQPKTTHHVPYYCGVRLGEARQIEWSQVDLDAKLIRLEEDQTKNAEARTIPLTDALIQMLKPTKPKEGRVSDDTNLRKAWQKACAAAGLGSWIKVDGVADKRYILVSSFTICADRQSEKSGECRRE
jgi:integrase